MNLKNIKLSKRSQTQQEHKYDLLGVKFKAWQNESVVIESKPMVMVTVQIEGCCLGMRIDGGMCYKGAGGKLWGDGDVHYPFSKFLSISLCFC